MPTYDYKCKACDHTFELFQSMTAKHEKKCPSCGKLKLERLIGTGAALIFKGGGFYQTDYRTESYKQGESAAQSAGKDATKPADTSTSDSKPASATESKSAKSEPAPATAKAESKPVATSESPSAKKSAAKRVK